MLYQQHIDFCFGQDRLAKAEADSLITQATEILKDLRQASVAGQLPIISLAGATDDLKMIEDLASQIRSRFKTLVVLGTGGSSLCGHALVGFCQNQFSAAKTRVIFMQNIDPHSFSQFFAGTDLSQTTFLTISKSGQSVESLSQLLACLEQGNNLKIPEHFFSITTPGDNPLRRISQKFGIKVFDHDPEVGGRFSILSLVGLIPGMVAGIDAKKLRAGAKKLLGEQAELAATSAALHVAFMRKNIWQNVLMTYPDRLEDLNIWYRQIWAESLGKNGTGSTPIKAMGTIDQHSQMQLYLGGRKDKFYNFITLKMPADKLKLATDDEELKYLNGKTLGELLNAEQKATIETLAANNRPVRVIELEKLDEETLGMLIMHLMLETIIAAKLLGVNPYDQPAVEEGKARTKKLMEKSSTQ